MCKGDESISVVGRTRGSEAHQEHSVPEQRSEQSEKPPPPITRGVRRKNRYLDGCHKPCVVMFKWLSTVVSERPDSISPLISLSIPYPTRTSGEEPMGRAAEYEILPLPSDGQPRATGHKGTRRPVSHVSAKFMRPRHRLRLQCRSPRSSLRSRLHNSRRNCSCPQVEKKLCPVDLSGYRTRGSKLAPETEMFQGGCQHYKRNCALKAQCCGKFHTCRFCHDEASDHGDMDRFATKEVSCLRCGTEQPVSNKCRNEECGIVFAHYFCAVCKFFDDSKKDVFHCGKCGICRTGKSEDSFHCDKCDSCVKRKYETTHKCHQGALHGECPCCLEHLHSSVRPVLFMRCGHAMHSDCFDRYTRDKYTCPLCSKSLSDMSIYFKEIGELLKLQNWQSEIDEKYIQVKCNDCGRTSRTRYHPWNLYRCGDGDACGSYNTIVTSTCGS